MTLTGKAEYILENVAECGLYNVVLQSALVILFQFPNVYSIVFMVFGNYNPGWRCVDSNMTSLNTLNNTRIDTTVLAPTTSLNTINNARIDTTVLAPTTLTSSKYSDEEEYTVGSCEEYKLCENVEFYPGTSTILTEWGLVCDKGWIISLIISIQMLGMLVGAFVSGQMADWFGRKKAIYFGVLMLTIFHLLSSFSVSWSMFIVVRFFLGMFGSFSLNIQLIYMSEFLTRKWRGIILNMPTWYIGTSLLSFVVWLLQDWRQIERFAVVLHCICLLSIFCVPESLRWLEVKHKSKEFLSVSKRIAKINRKKLPLMDDWEFSRSEIKIKKKENKRYSVLDLFRKGYKVITVCVVFLNLSLSLLYYALTFGTKSLYGDFYFNFLISNLIPLPFGLGGMLAMKYMRRRIHTSFFLSITVLCAIISVGILLSNDRSAKDFGSTVLISVSKGALDVAWLGVYARCTEIYPTVVRGIGIGAATVGARVGGILAPFLIPKDQSVLYVFMIFMAILAAICCLASLKLPETKGKPLKETFDDQNLEDSEVEMRSPCKI